MQIELPLSPSLAKRERVVTVYSFQIPRSAIAKFNDWCTGIGKEIQQFEGFLNRELIFPPASTVRSKTIDVTVILFFDTYEHLELWQNSTERDRWLQDGVSAGILDYKRASMGQSSSSLIARVNVEQARSAMPLTIVKWARCVLQ